MNSLPPLALSNTGASAFRRLGVALTNDHHSVRTGQACLANEALIVQSTYIEEITAWGIGYANAADNRLRVLRDFLAPGRPGTSRTIRLTQYDETEPWFTVDNQKIKRSVLGDFMEVRQRTAIKVDRLIFNRGLCVTLDLDELKDKPHWQQTHTQWLIDLLMRATVLEAIAIYQAAATVLNVTWDAASNPDLDIKTELIALANVTGFKPSRAVFGDTASLKRQQAYEQQLTAGSLAHSQMMTDEEIAVACGLGEVLTDAERYQSTTTAKSEIVGSNVYVFTAFPDESPEDASNVVRHVANASYGGGEYAVYLTPIGVKKVVLTVENYELLATQHTTGIAQLAIR